MNNTLKIKKIIALIILLNISFAFISRAQMFIPNMGQYTGMGNGTSIEYFSSAKSSQAFVTKNSVQYIISSTKKIANIDNKRIPEDSVLTIDSTEYIEMKFLNANAGINIMANGIQTPFNNFHFTKGSVSVALNHVEQYDELYLQNVWPNIDIKYFYTNGNLKYDFVVLPGGNVSNIKFIYQGAQSLNIDSSGNLHIEGHLGELVHFAPQTTQNGGSISSQYLLSGDTVSLQCGSYNTTDTLTIDPPTIIMGEYINEMPIPGSIQRIWDVKRDIAGNSYTVGDVLTGFGGGCVPDEDVILKMIDVGGNTIWSTVFGGSLRDIGLSLAIDNIGDIHICGFTYSEDLGHLFIPFPFTPYNYVFGTNGTNCFADGFYACFDPTGAPLTVSFLGGIYPDYCQDVTVDDCNNAYVVGFTLSPDNNSAAPGGIMNGGNNAPYPWTLDDGFITKLHLDYTTNVTGTSTLDWGRFYGGEDLDELQSICYDYANEAVVAVGYTLSDNTATNLNLMDIDGTSADFTYNGGGDAVVARFDLNTGASAGATYLGANQYDFPWGIAADYTNVYVGGKTNSTNFATTGAAQVIYGGNALDGFLAKVRIDMQQIFWITYCGGSDWDEITNVTSTCNEVQACGYSGSTNNISTPATAPHQATLSGTGMPFTNGIIESYDNLTGARIWGSYYGDYFTRFYGICNNEHGEVTAAGLTDNSNLIAYNAPAGNAWDGDVDGCLATFSGTAVNFCDCTTPPPATNILYSGTTYTNISFTNQTLYLVNTGGGTQGIITLAGNSNLISGCEIICEEGTSLVVKPNAKLLINNSPSGLTVFHACTGKSWQGIYQQYNSFANTGWIHIIGTDRANQVLITDATNGLWVRNGAPFICEFAHFDRNLNGIRITDHDYATYSGGFYPCVIDGSSFTCTSNLNCAFMPETRGTRGIFAIDLNSPPLLDGLFIGETTIDPLLYNDFSDTEMGIDLSNTNALILNNQFSNFYTTIPATASNSTSYNEGVAIRGRPNAANDPVKIEVGNSFGPSFVQFYNIFTDCFRGIMLGNFISDPTNYDYGLKVHFNQFNNIDGPIYATVQMGTTFLNQGPNAIEVNGGTGNEYQIQYNEFNEIHFGGINLHNLDFCNSVITKNYFGNSSTATVFQGSEAIHVFSDAAPTLSAFISDNQIRNFRFGINCSGMEAPEIEINTIAFFRNQVIQANGIRMNNCVAPSIRDNSVTRITGTANGVGPCCMYIENCDKAFIEGNSTDQGRFGLYFNNYSTGFNIVCNSFNNHVGTASDPGAGVYFNDCTPGTPTQITSEFSTLAPSGNQWNNCTAHLDGAGSNLFLVRWFFSLLNGPNYNPFPYTGSATSIAYITNNIPDHCMYLIAPPIVECDNADEECRQLLMGAAAGDTSGIANATVIANEQTQYRIAERAFRNLFTGKVPIEAGVSTDPLYVAFFDSVMNTNIALIAMIDSMIASGDTTAATLLNQQMMTDNISELYQKQVNEISISRMKSHADSFTTAQFNTLLAIATQPAFLSDAIYQARQLLNVTVDEEVYSNRQEQPDKLVVNELIIQPNPADNTAAVLLNLAENESAQLSVIDLQGRIIYSITVNDKMKLLPINTAVFANGLYSVQLISKSKICLNGKLVIAH